MELAKAGIFVVAILLIYPYDECSGAYASYPIERILRSNQDNLHHQHHRQRSQSNDHHQDDRYQNEHHQNDRHQNEYNQNDRYANEQNQNDRNEYEYHQNDRHDNEYHQNDRYQNDHHQNDRDQNDHQQNHHHQNDRHSNHDDLRWSRPQEFEIIHATSNDVSPVLVLGKPAREHDTREVNDPNVLDMEVKPIETQYEIISAKDIDTEPKPRKIIVSAAEKPVKGKKSVRRPKASVHENIAVNSLMYSKISKLNK